MRKITKESAEAFYRRGDFKSGNTEVKTTFGDTVITELRLFGNTIAKYENSIISITDAGWNTTTTRERLNGLDGVSINQSKGQLYLNGNQWNGEWIEI